MEGGDLTTEYSVTAAVTHKEITDNEGIQVLKCRIEADALLDNTGAVAKFKEALTKEFGRSKGSTIFELTQRRSDQNTQMMRERRLQKQLQEELQQQREGGRHTIDLTTEPDSSFYQNEAQSQRLHSHRQPSGALKNMDILLPVLGTQTDRIAGWNSAAQTHAANTSNRGVNGYNLVAVPLVALEPFLQESLDYLRSLDVDGSFLFEITENAVPGYSAVVKCPMDFTKMQRKLDKHQYLGFMPFNSDIQLMVRNCRKYNGASSPFTKMALMLQREWKQRWCAFERRTIQALRSSSVTDPNTVRVTMAPLLQELRVIEKNLPSRVVLRRVLTLAWKYLIRMNKVYAIQVIEHTVPEYSPVVQDSMSLRETCVKISRGSYVDIEDFQRDVQQMVGNLRKFYTEEDEYVRQAGSFLLVWQVFYEEACAAWPAVSARQQTGNTCDSSSDTSNDRDSRKEGEEEEGSASDPATTGIVPPQQNSDRASHGDQKHRECGLGGDSLVRNTATVDSTKRQEVVGEKRKTNDTDENRNSSTKDAFKRVKLTTSGPSTSSISNGPVTIQQRIDKLQFLVLNGNEADKKVAVELLFAIATAPARGHS